MNEIVQPYGATKRPSDSLLQTFYEKCKNLEPTTILGILIGVLKDETASWVSQLRALYAIEVLVKNQSYFEALKYNHEELTKINWDRLKSQSESGVDNMLRLKQSIISKLDNVFSTPQTKAIEVDLSRLEAFKDKNNIKFFQKMEAIKQQKKDEEGEVDFFSRATKPSSTENFLDLVDFGDSARMKKETKNNLNDSNLLDVNLTSEQSHISILEVKASVYNPQVPNAKAIEQDVDLLSHFDDLQVGHKKKSQNEELIDLI